MLSLDIQITWATPVQAIKLYAHTRAYLESLPTVEALRLCNRYGRGEQAHITKLPTELLTQIEDHLIHEKKQAVYLHWTETIYGCFTDTCNGFAPHFDGKKLVEYYNKLSAEGKVEPLQSNETRPTRDQFDLVDSFSFGGLLDENSDRIHHEYARKWMQQIDELFCATKQEEIERLFGLQVHISHPVVKPPFINRDLQMFCRLSWRGRLTVAHITLPSLTHIKEDLDLSYESEQPIDSDNVILRAIPPTSQQLTAIMKQKFNRMMKILDLETFAYEKNDAQFPHFYYCSKASQSPTTKEKKVQTEASPVESSQRWPQLMVLATAPS